MMTRKLPPPAALRRISGARSMLYVLRTWLLIAATIALAIAAHTLAAYLLAFVLIGVLQYHLNILGHDGIHYSLASNKGLNDWICRLLLHGPQSAPLSLLRRNHLLHHRVLGQELDPDKNYYRIDRFSSRAQVAIWLSASFVGGNTIPLIGKLLGAKKDRKAEANELPVATIPRSGLLLDFASIALTQALIALAITWISGSVIFYFLLWVAPLFTVMFGLNTLRSCLEHVETSADLPDSRQLRYNSFRSNPVERFFLSPFCMNHHAEHHYWPSVPFYHLRAAQKELASEQHAGFRDRTRYHASYATRLREILA